MKPEGSLGGHLTYSQNLIDSGVRGLRSGRESYLKGQSLCDALGDFARHSLGFAVLGAIAGFIPLSLRATHARVQRRMAWGGMGCAIGFCAGFVWQTRQLTGSMARGALRKMEAASDEHWLERHPIDYA